MQSTSLRNSLLQTLDNSSFAVATLYASLHKGNPGITGANELTGGSYARQLVSLGAASGGAIANDAALSFTGMPAVASSDPLTHVGLWSASSAGTFYWAGPIGTQKIIVFTAANTGDLFTAPGHGLVNGASGDMVDLVDIYDSALPAGVSEFTNYFVVGGGADTFQVSATQNGSAITLTGDGAGMLRRIQPKSANSGDTVSIAISALVAALK